METNSPDDPKPANSSSPAPALTKAQKHKNKMDEKKRKLAWQTALYEASLQGNNLRITWTSIPFIDPAIYTYQASFGVPLQGVRLIGVELEALPDDFCPQLRSLEVLVLESNHLVSLPDNLDSLTSLRELGLANNRLQSLPARVGFLCSLLQLTLNNNALTSLPPSLGALANLQRLDLEGNALRVLPECLDNLTLCRSLNLNHNRLTRLPRCAGRMPALTSLSACHNLLTYLPLDLCASLSLTCLRLSQNQISALPEKLGELSSLRELCLDHNRLARLPLSFHRLAQLDVLRLDGNAALLDPPPEVLTLGARRVVRYFHDLFHSDRAGRMRHIVLATQNVLAQAAEAALFDAACFEPDLALSSLLSPSSSSGASAGGGGGGAAGEDLWFATQPRYLFDVLLPRLREHWDSLLSRSASTSTSRRHRQQQQQQLPQLLQSDSVTSFSFSESEVLWAWANYADAVGPVLRQESAVFFRRCGCATPCIPPRVGFQCSRPAFLFKKQLVRLRDKQERVWRAYKLTGEADAVRRAEAEAAAYLASHEGRDWLEATAYEQAEEVLLETGISSVVQRRVEAAEQRKKRVIADFERRKAAVARSRDAKVAALQADLHKYKEARKLTPEGYLRDVLEQRITQTAKALASLPESLALAQLTQQCEMLVRRVDEDLYSSSASSDDDFSYASDQSSPYDSDDSDEEAVRWRRRRDRFLAKKRDADQLRRMQEQFDALAAAAAGRDGNKANKTKQAADKAAAAAAARAQPASDEPQGVWDGLTQDMGRLSRAIAGAVTPAVQKASKFTARRIRKARRFARDFVEVQGLRWTKMVNKLAGGFDEVQRECAAELRRQYIQHQVALAREKVRHEFAVIERVRENMHGASKEMAFIRWKKWVWEKQRRLRRDARQAFQRATKGFLVAVESVRSAQEQVDMWIRQQDIFNDNVFYQHRRTGAITFDTPGLEHYLPPNFSIPRAIPAGVDTATLLASGEELLGKEDSDDDDSDESDLAEWQRKYGNDRQRLRAVLEQENDAKAPVPQVLAPTLPAGTTTAGGGGGGEGLGKEEDDEHLTYEQRFARAVQWARSILQSPEYAHLFPAQSDAAQTHGASPPAATVAGAIEWDVNAPQEFDGEAVHAGLVVRAADTLAEVAAHAAEKSRDEYERAYKVIRRVRNADSSTRRDLYLKQAARKARAHEQSMALQALPCISSSIVSLESGARAAATAAAAAGAAGAAADGATPAAPTLGSQPTRTWATNPLHPTHSELLALAGGNLEMIHTGKEGVDLRTVLAQRAVQIKAHMRDQAVRKNPRLRGRYKKNFFQREIAPIFMHQFEASSSDSEDNDEVRKRDRAERKAQRREERKVREMIERVEVSKADEADPRKHISSPSSTAARS